MNETTTKEAYLAMFSFLENYYELTKSDDIGSLLGSMSLLQGGGTADPAIWKEWLEAIARMEKGKVDVELKFNK